MWIPVKGHYAAHHRYEKTFGYLLFLLAHHLVILVTVIPIPYYTSSLLLNINFMNGVQTQLYASWAQDYTMTLVYATFL